MLLVAKIVADVFHLNDFDRGFLSCSVNVSAEMTEIGLSESMQRAKF